MIGAKALASLSAAEFPGSHSEGIFKAAVKIREIVKPGLLGDIQNAGAGGEEQS